MSFKDEVKNELTEEPFEIQTVEGFDLIMGKVTVINPALDFFDNHLILTLPFIWNKPVIDDDGQIKGHKPEMTNFALTLPEKDFFILNGNELIKRGLFAKAPSGTFPQRWSNDSFMDFFERGKKVNPYEIFKRIKGAYEYYMDYGDRQSHVTTYKAAYIIMTYFHPLFNYLGYDKLEGDTTSGKSKSALIDLQLGFNAISSVDASAAAIYRIIQERSSTLIVDEFEGHSAKDPDKLQILTILNAGFQKGLTIPRIDMKGKNPSLLESSPYGPKTIASIDSLYETLRNRSHLIRSVRTLNREKSNREVSINDPEWQSIRDDLYLLLVNYFGEVKELSNEKYDDRGLDSRDLNKAKPILTVIRFICNYAGSDSERIVDDIKKFFENQKEENKEVSTESFEAIIINRLEITTENIIANKHEIKKGEGEDAEEKFRKRIAEFSNENAEIKVPAISEAIALDSGLDIESSRFNKISYSKRISQKLKTMGLKKNPRVTHNNITVFECSLSDITNAKTRYGLLSGQSILSNLPIQSIPPIPPIPKNEDSGIESRDSIDGIGQSSAKDQEEFKKGKGAYFKILESCHVKRKGTLKKGLTIFLYHNEASRLIQEGFVKLACPNGYWDPQEKQCVLNGGQSQ
ncbi:MAG: hypothetical protein M0Z77_08055 [Thermoplasmatales archaeon]|nr:hypothetical protein [Thermoplasmatales archaeon]